MMKQEEFPMAKTVKIGMVGVGDISGISLQNITQCFK